MQNTALYDQIIVKLRITSEATLLIHYLESLSDNIYVSKDNLYKQQILKKLPQEIATFLNNEFEILSPTPQDQIRIKREINDLLDKLRRYKSVKLTIAFQPDEETITLFSDWFKKNIGNDVLIDLQFDKSIVGGAQLIVNGIYKDFTVRKNLNNRYQIQREEIMKMLD